jgi:ribonuclease HI
MKYCVIYTDGSAIRNPGPGGWGTIIVMNNPLKEIELSGNENNTTNNRMELLAVIKGLEALDTPHTVDVMSDSTYVVNGINMWLGNWKRRKFINVKNSDLWKRLLKAMSGHMVQAYWIKGHNGHVMNERCDKLANTKARELMMKKKKGRKKK